MRDSLGHCLCQLLPISLLFLCPLVASSSAHSPSSLSTSDRGCSSEMMQQCAEPLRQLGISSGKNLVLLLLQLHSPNQLRKNCQAYSIAMPCFRKFVHRCGVPSQAEILRQMENAHQFLCSPFSGVEQSQLLAHRLCIGRVLGQLGSGGTSGGESCAVAGTGGTTVGGKTPLNATSPMAIVLFKCRERCLSDAAGAMPESARFGCLVRAWLSEQNLCLSERLRAECGREAAAFYTKMQRKIFHPQFPLICEQNERKTETDNNGRREGHNEWERVQKKNSKNERDDGMEKAPSAIAVTQPTIFVTPKKRRKTVARLSEFKLKFTGNKRKGGSNIGNGTTPKGSSSGSSTTPTTTTTTTASSSATTTITNAMPFSVASPNRASSPAYPSSTTASQIMLIPFPAPPPPSSSSITAPSHPLPSSSSSLPPSMLMTNSSSAPTVSSTPFFTHFASLRSANIVPLPNNDSFTRDHSAQPFAVHSAVPFHFSSSNDKQQQALKRNGSASENAISAERRAVAPVTLPVQSRQSQSTAELASALAAVSVHSSSSSALPSVPSVSFSPPPPSIPHHPHPYYPISSSSFALPSVPSASSSSPPLFPIPHHPTHYYSPLSSSSYAVPSAATSPSPPPSPPIPRHPPHYYSALSSSSSALPSVPSASSSPSPHHPPHYYYSSSVSSPPNSSSPSSLLLLPPLIPFPSDPTSFASYFWLNAYNNHETPNHLQSQQQDGATRRLFFFEVLPIDEAIQNA